MVVCLSLFVVRCLLVFIILCVLLVVVCHVVALGFYVLREVRCSLCVAC